MNSYQMLLSRQQECTPPKRKIGIQQSLSHHSIEQLIRSSQVEKTRRKLTTPTTNTDESLEIISEHGAFSAINGRENCQKRVAQFYIGSLDGERSENECNESKFINDVLSSQISA